MKKSLLLTPDIKRIFPKGNLSFAQVDKVSFALATSNKGWHWKKHVQPFAGTEWCEVPHTFYEISGTMHFKMKNGDELEVEAGDAAHIPPGHDAWVVGDEPAMSLNVTKPMTEKYAKP